MFDDRQIKELEELRLKLARIKQGNRERAKKHRENHRKEYNEYHKIWEREQRRKRNELSN